MHGAKRPRANAANLQHAHAVQHLHGVSVEIGSVELQLAAGDQRAPALAVVVHQLGELRLRHAAGAAAELAVAARHLDRKSTRLNSSHSQISYAVFCLKKKKKKQAA